VRQRSALLSVVFLILAASAWGENATPPSPLAGASDNSNEIAVSGAVMLRHELNTGTGVDAAITHYFVRNLGFTADADLMRSNYLDFREYGFRGGPTFRLLPERRLQFFAHGLFGYARFKDTGTGSARPYENGFSYVAGGGADVRVAGPISARMSGDFEHFTATGGANPTRLLRFGFGLKYSFGNHAH